MSSTVTNKPEQAQRLSSNIRLFNYMSLSKFQYEWTTEDNSFLGNIFTIKDRSPDISTNNDGYKLVWEMFYTVGPDCEDLAGLSLVSLESCNDIEAYARYTIRKAGSYQVLQFGTWNMNEPLPAIKELPVKKPRYLKESMDPKDTDKMVVLLELDIVQRERTRNNKLSDNLGALFKSGTASDVVFILGDRSVKAHRAILTARNQKFAKMLKKADLGKTREMIDIRDVDGYIFEKVLHFIYTGTEPASVNDRMCDLLIAADKYKIEDLKKLCEESLMNDLSTDNAANAFVSAHLVNSEVLKAKIMDFIFANKDEVVDTAGYENMVKSHIYLVEEMFRRIKLN